MAAAHLHRTAILLATLVVVGVAPTARGEPSRSYGLAQRLVDVAIHKPAYLLMRAAGLRVEGRQNVPREGGVILAPNHPSVLDPILVGVSSPRPQPHFMAKMELFRSRPLGAVLRFFNAYPVDRAHPSLETRAHTEKMLTAGGQVIIFPEGGVRTGVASVLATGELKKGVGHFSANTNVPVVPVLVTGTAEVGSRVVAWLHGKRSMEPWVRPRVVFGKPFSAPPGLTPAERASWVTDRLKSELREMGRANAR